MSKTVPNEGFPSIVMGSFLALAGVLAYQQTGSRIFLFGGVIIGSANVLGGTMVDTGHERTGHITCAAADMSIFTTGISRLRTTKRPMPAIPIAALGCASAAYHLFKASQRPDTITTWT